MREPTILDPGTRRRVEEVIADLRRLRLDAPAILPRVAPMLGELLEYELTCLYRPWPTLEGVVLKDLQLVGSLQVEEAQAAYAAESDGGRLFAGYDPLRPATDQRNRVLEPKRVIPREQVFPSTMARVQRRLGIHHLQEQRVVVCDRRSTLAWVGGYRAKPYEPRDVAILEAVAAALRHRLAVEAQLALGAGAMAGDLAAAIEATDAAVVVTRDRDRSIAHANAAGRAWLTQRDATQGVRDALDGAPGHRVVRLQIGPAEGHSVVVLAPQSAAAPRWREQAKRWRLTPRQAEVLAHVVSGDANETVAAELGIGLRTVERHVAAIARRARVETRAALVAAALRGG